jgi:hypothetical protein
MKLKTMTPLLAIALFLAIGCDKKEEGAVVIQDRSKLPPGWGLQFDEVNSRYRPVKPNGSPTLMDDFSTPISAITYAWHLEELFAKADQSKWRDVKGGE